MVGPERPWLDANEDLVEGPIDQQKNSIEKHATSSCDIIISIDLVVENVYFNFRGDLHE